jgi:hypothetical protein
VSANSKTWRIAWTSQTGTSGHGTQLYYRHEAKQIATQENQDPGFRGITHRAEDTDVRE